MSRIKVNLTPKKEITLRPFVDDKQMVFSFKFFDRSKTDAFNLAKIESTWYIDFLDALKDISNKTVSEFRSAKKYDLHNWTSKSSKKYSFFIENQQLEEMQFRLDKSSGRIHGFLIDNVFYIVWLDPFHKMTDIKGYEIEKDYPPALSSYEKLQNENDVFKNRVAKMEKDIDDLLSI